MFARVNVCVTLLEKDSFDKMKSCYVTFFLKLLQE